MNMDMNASNGSYNSFPSSSSYETPLSCTDGSGSFSSELEAERGRPYLRLIRERTRRREPERNKFKETDIGLRGTKRPEAFRHIRRKTLGGENEENYSTFTGVWDFMNEDELPGFLDSMAEALMLPPPQCAGYGNFFDDVESCSDMSLWNF
ncbi:hypothetical protein Tco_0951379 [Tanacetum coccineum]|uniref:Uncharacterized protein n=1 Tax=Tanacetum coccineum TaxID=301880 RepID=A0ABQ5DUU7_9ASTR